MVKKVFGPVMAVLLLGCIDAFAVNMDNDDYNDPDGALGYEVNRMDDARDRAKVDNYKMPDAGDINQVLAAMGDSSEGARVDAAKALGQMGGPEAVDALIKRLGEGNPEVRAAVAEALAQIGDPKAIEALQKQIGVEKNSVTQMRMRDALDQLQALVKGEQGKK